MNTELERQGARKTTPGRDMKPGSPECDVDQRETAHTAWLNSEGENGTRAAQIAGGRRTDLSGRTYTQKLQVSYQAGRILVTSGSVSRAQ